MASSRLIVDTRDAVRALIHHKELQIEEADRDIKKKEQEVKELKEEKRELKKELTELRNELKKAEKVLETAEDKKEKALAKVIEEEEKKWRKLLTICEKTAMEEITEAKTQKQAEEQIKTMPPQESTC